jgi:hypothetical protein
MIFLVIFGDKTYYSVSEFGVNVGVLRGNSMKRRERKWTKGKLLKEPEKHPDEKTRKEMD